MWYYAGIPLAPCPSEPPAQVRMMEVTGSAAALFLGGSAGEAVYPQKAASLDELQKPAGRRMYQDENRLQSTARG